MNIFATEFDSAEAKLSSTVRHVGFAADYLHCSQYIY